MTRAVNRIVTQGKNPNESLVAPRMVLSSTDILCANEYPNAMQRLPSITGSQYKAKQTFMAKKRHTKKSDALACA
jgi:hypothetical protein